MKVWVDADACPGAVKEIIIRAALKRAVVTVFVANTKVSVMESPYLSSVQVPQGADVADQYIVTHAHLGDLVISQDIPLAHELVSKGLTVITPYGTLLTVSNIGERLSTRDFSYGLREAGLMTGGPKPFGEKEKRLFASCFDQELTRLQKSGF